ncbi:putative lipid II flippase FtsW [Galactobacter sp.]|uniref:putative lipid II flippase FtsW n=1 Tax=Galactobacter sp. TaxID=2676125 RepID=UPI0025BF245C|nr:putative lipid II flippase FtsW [Galactobacter sp.]
MARRRRPAAEGETPKVSFLRRQWDRVESTDAAGIRTAYYLIIICTAILTCLGMIMVLSSSAVEYISANRDPYSLFAKQATFGVIGLVLMFGMALISPKFLKRLAWVALGVALLLLVAVLVPGIGRNVLGNQNWIQVGPVGIQPSEFAKLALILWSATVFSAKEKLLDRWTHTVVPVLFPVGALVVLLILLERDLGTVMIVLLVLLALLWAGGAPKLVFVLTAAAAVAAVLVIAVISPNRLGRINSWLGRGGADDALGTGLQTMQAKYALASGGWFGVGLGQSRSKWSYIPEAQNDFILSIIGEELGLIGTLAVVVIFIVLVISMYRVAHRSQDLFVRVLTTGVIAWLGGQAFINMGMVTGLAPVIGVTLPFISYGGSSLLACLLAVGLVLNAARDQIRNGVPALGPTVKTSPEGKA